MCESVADLPREAGLTIDENEKRLRALTERQGRDDRNISYYLLEVEKRNLFSKQGFSNIFDYATELLGFNRRKCQYLLAIARGLEKFPAISAAFDSGEVTWTKVREIIKVATLETEKEWLEKAERMSNRELEQAVKCSAPAGEFQTVRISMPEDFSTFGSNVRRWPSGWPSESSNLGRRWNK